MSWSNSSGSKSASLWQFLRHLEGVRIQLNSDSVHPKTASDSIDQGLSPTGLPHTHQKPVASPSHPCASDKLAIDYTLLELQAPVANPVSYLYLWLTGCKSEGPMTSSLALIHLLEHLKELRKPVDSPDHWIIIKGCNSGMGRWKECPGQDTGEGTRGSWMCPNSHVLTKLDILQNLSFWVFIEAPLHRYWSFKSLATQSPAPLPFPEVRSGLGSGSESFDPLVIWLIFLRSSSHPWVFPKELFFNITKDIFIALLT